MKPNRELGLLVLRVGLGILLLLHGLAKLQSGIGWMGEMISSKGLPSILSYGVYIGEVVAPLMILAGFRTRLAALFVVFNMLVAIGLVHLEDIAKFTDNGGWAVELPVLFLLAALTLFFTGGGELGCSSTSKWD